jgi:hypothetical protein
MDARRFDRGLLFFASDHPDLDCHYGDTRSDIWWCDVQSVILSANVRKL